MSELWRAVPGFEGFYEVSDQGRVRSIDRVFIRADGRRQGRRGRVLKPAPSGGMGYPAVGLRFGLRRTVHVLVCQTFHGAKPAPHYEVAHIDGDVTNCRATNLRWSTHADNMADARAHGTYPLRPGLGGEEAGFSRLTWPQVDEIRRRWNGGETQISLAVAFGMGKSQIHNIVRGKNWDESWRP